MSIPSPTCGAPPQKTYILHHSPSFCSSRSISNAISFRSFGWKFKFKGKDPEKLLILCLCFQRFLCKRSPVRPQSSICLSKIKGVFLLLAEIFHTRSKARIAGNGYQSHALKKESANLPVLVVRHAIKMKKPMKWLRSSFDSLS